MARRDRQQSLPGLDEADPPEPDPAPATRATAPSPTDLAGWDVYVVDAHSLIFQVFHALPDMTSPRGEHVGAVYGFVRDMLYLVEQKQPAALLCAFDRPGPTFRNDLFAGYKADRSEMPVELVGQIPKIEQVLGAMSVPVLSYEGFEADDVLATLARLCDEAGAKCYLVSGDKDCRQLITDRVGVYNIRKDEVFDAKSLAAEWGVRPEQVVDFQALVGDKVDNVPGVPTIGPKTAQALLEKYGSLDEVLAHAEEIPGAKGKRIAEGRELALLSRQLVRLDDQLPIAPDWNAARVGEFDHQLLAELFAEFGFRTFGERFARHNGGAAPTEWEADYQLVETPAKLKKLVAELSKQPLISVDTSSLAGPRWWATPWPASPARRTTCRCAARRASECSTRKIHSTPCGLCWRTHPSANWARI
jgi:DNA polymerase-1